MKNVIDRWSDNIDKFMTNNLKGVKTIDVMQTPLVIQNFGNIKNIPIQIDISILNKILTGKHNTEITPDVLKQIPGAMTQPMFLFKTEHNRTHKPMIGVMLSLRGKNNIPVFVPILLNETVNNDGSVVNKIMSVYEREAMISNTSKWFDNVLGGVNGQPTKLLYIDKKRIDAWSRSLGPQSPTGLDYRNNSLLNNILNEDDLVKLKNENPSYYQSAFHGTPYNFPKFDLGMIGAGTGRQTEGWGIYFTKDRKVAEAYRQHLELPFQIKENNKIHSNIEIKNKYNLSKEDVTNILNSFSLLENVKNPILKDYRNATFEMLTEAFGMTDEEANNTIEKAKPLFNDLSNNKLQLEKSSGTVFEVDIPDNNVLMDRQKMLDKQPVKVKNAIKKIFASLPAERLRTTGMGSTVADAMKNTNGATFYDVLDAITGSDRAASEILNSYGIKGMTYVGERDGRCYVVFDDKAIEIINKYNQQI